VPLDYYNMPIARTDFRKICISSHSSGTTFANTYFRNTGVFNRSTKVISSKRYLQFPVGNNVLGLGIRCKQRAVKASNPILHSGTLIVPLLVHTREYKTKVISGPLVHYEFTVLKTCRSGTRLWCRIVQPTWNGLLISFVLSNSLTFRPQHGISF
jgi:hypothetical protein